MKGHKIAGAGANLPWISGVGAVPVQSNLNEAYTSLQTGVYEGWIMTVTGVQSYKMHEISKYLTYMGFGAASQLLVYMNLKNFNKLPKEVQKISGGNGRRLHRKGDGNISSKNAKSRPKS